MQQNTPQPSGPVIAAAPPRATPSASAIYEGFKAQRNELTNQLDHLENTRRDITNQLEQTAPGSPERKGLEDRLGDVDTRIKAVDQMLAGNSAQLAQAAAVPGAVVEQPPPVQIGPPEEVYVLTGIFMFVALFPLSIAFARRIWRRSAAAVTTLPRELVDRLLRLEQSVEATSLEVERIGEGQRFLTKLFTEGEGARMIGAPRSTETKQPNARERLP